MADSEMRDRRRTVCQKARNNKSNAMSRIQQIRRGKNSYNCCLANSIKRRIMEKIVKISKGQSGRTDLMKKRNAKNFREKIKKLMINKKKIKA